MANLTGRGAPTDHTVGARGDVYTNELTGVKYQCTGSYSISAYGVGAVTYCWSVMPEGAPVVSSWNDLTDKPFGLISTETLIIPEQEARFLGGLCSIETPNFARFDVGAEYEISINGTTFVGICEEYQNQSNFAMRTRIKFQVNEFGVITVTASEDGGRYGLHDAANYAPNGTYSIGLKKKAVYKTLDSALLPKAAAVADVTSVPTAEDFNALLTSLRNAGYLTK